MKLGDRVEYVGSDIPELTGKQGILRTVMRGYAGVEFDEDVPDGHDLNGKCPERRGLYLNEGEVSVVPKYHLNEELYSIEDNKYGFHGKVIGIETSFDDDTKYYTIEAENGCKRSIIEPGVVTEEEFIPCPVSIGQYVKLKPTEYGYLPFQDERLLNCYFGFPVQITGITYDILENTFDIALNLNDMYSYHATLDMIEVVETESDDVNHNFASFFHNLIAKSSTDEYQDIKTKLYTNGILEKMPYVNIGSASFRKNLVALLLGMCFMPTPREMKDMGFEIQTYIKNLHYSVYMPTIDTIWDESGLDSYRHAGAYWIFIPLVKEDTQEKIEATKRQTDRMTRTYGGLYIEDEGDCHYQIIYYDPLNFESLVDNLLHLMENPDSELWNLMVNKKYDEAFKLFLQWNDMFKECLDSTAKLYAIQQSVSYLQKQESRRIERELNSILSSIEDYQEALAEKFEKLRDAQLRMIGVKNGDTDENAKMLVQFLQGMGDNLVSLTVEGNTFVIQLKQPLLYIDQDLYRDMHVRKQYEDKYVDATLNIVDDIIIGKVSLTMEETVGVELNNSSISCRQRGRDSWCKNVTEGVPNPHHYYFNCWGQNQTPIVKAFATGNYIVGISQIMSAVGGLNVADGAVMNKFIYMIDLLRKGSYDYWNLNKCITYKGTKMTVKEYAIVKAEESEG